MSKKICLQKITEKNNFLERKILPFLRPSRRWAMDFPSVFGTDVLPETTEEEATELFARRNVESFGQKRPLV